MEEKQMIKKLFGTTALAGLVCTAVGSAPIYAETISTGAVPPSLTINGNSIVNTYFGNQKVRQNGRGGPQPHIAIDVSDLYFTALGRAANGLEYMYKVNFQAYAGSNPTVSQNYIQFKGKFGTVQLGMTVGPEDFAIVDAGKVIGGTGGFDGGYSNVFNVSAGVMRGNDIVGDTGNATKIVYISPEVMGWQFSIAYTPSTARQGDDKLDNQTGKGADVLPGNRGLYSGMYNTADYHPFGLRNVAIGITYRKEIGKWSYTLSGAGLTEKSYYNALDAGAQRFSMQNAKAYQLGFLVGYESWRFGAGWLDNGKSRLPREDNFKMRSVSLDTMNRGNAGKAWNLGVGYVMGAYQLGASYQRTDRKTDAINKAASDVYTATVDVTPLQGLKFGGEVNYIRTTTNANMVAREQRILDVASKQYRRANGNNSGVVAVVTTKIAF
jgi:hypothetical protein